MPYDVIIKQQEKIIKKQIQELEELKKILELIKSRDYEVILKKVKKNEE